MIRGQTLLSGGPHPGPHDVNWVIAEALREYTI